MFWPNLLNYFLNLFFEVSKIELVFQLSLPCKQDLGPGSDWIESSDGGPGPSEANSRLL